MYFISFEFCGILYISTVWNTGNLGYRTSRYDSCYIAYKFSSALFVWQAGQNTNLKFLAQLEIFPYVSY